MFLRFAANPLRHGSLLQSLFCRSSSLRPTVRQFTLTRDSVPINMKAGFTFTRVKNCQFDPPHRRVKNVHRAPREACINLYVQEWSLHSWNG
jgi:hypothetical protein